uniref:MFS domain-containing protein n=1 Tax=Caenorhabditis tropicalis TaxID=1561998 RepID=A0A1I7U704_9PELO
MHFWGDSYRYLILFVGFLCLSSVCSNYIIINFTFICMKEDTSMMTNFNGTQRNIYDYTSEEKKYIMWAVGAGTVLGTVPTNWLVVKYGAKWPFLVAGLVSSISTTLIPFAAANNFLFLLFLRFLQGLSYSTDFAAIGIITVRWAPLQETAFFIALLTCFTGVASMITNSATGLICESSFGWKYAYYFHSFAGLILFALWAGIYIDDPQDSRRISEKELSRIHKNKSAAHLDKKGDIPYIKIFTSPVVLVVWMNAFFEMTAVIFFATYMPIYLHQVLKFSVAETGFYVAIILGMNIPLRLVAAAFSDRITIISERAKIIIFNTLSVGVSGLALAGIG